MIDYSMLKAISKISDDPKVKSIVNSLNPNQEDCKTWLVSESIKYFDLFEKPRFLVAAGWYGNLANKLSDHGEVLSFDMDINCAIIGKKLYPKVKFKTHDMIDYRSVKKHDVIICTSCEHIEQDVLNEFIGRRRKDDSIVILQSNNYTSLPEHINCVKDYYELNEQSNITKPYYYGRLKLKGRDDLEYKRFMVIGKRDG